MSNTLMEPHSLCYNKKTKQTSVLKITVWKKTLAVKNFDGKKTLMNLTNQW